MFTLSDPSDLLYMSIMIGIRRFEKLSIGLICFGLFSLFDSVIVVADELPIAPEPIMMTQVGNMVDHVGGRNFHLVYDDKKIRYAYLDFVKNKYMEGRLSNEWDPIEIRSRSLPHDPYVGAGSFLVFEKRERYESILVWTRSGGIYWSIRDGEWEKLDCLEGQRGALPVRYQLAEVVDLFFSVGKLDGGIFVYKFDTKNGECVEVSGPKKSYWEVVGRWNGETVICKRGDHLIGVQGVKTGWVPYFAISGNERSLALLARGSNQKRRRKAGVSIGSAAVFD